MAPYLIFDIVYIAILVIFALIGFIRGWARTFFQLIAIAGAIGVAFLTYQMVAPFVLNFQIGGNTVAGMVENTVGGMIANQLGELSEMGIPPALATEHNLKVIVMGKLNLPEILWNLIWVVMKDHLTPSSDGLVYLGPAVVTAISAFAGNVLSFLLIAIAAWLILTILFAIIFAIVKARKRRKASIIGEKYKKGFLSRFVGFLLGIILPAGLIFGANIGMHLVSRVEALKSVFDIESALAVQDDSVNSLSKIIYTYTGKLADQWFPTVQDDPSLLANFVITVKPEEGPVELPSTIIGDAVTNEDIPAEFSDYIYVDDSGNLNLTMPEDKTTFDSLASDFEMSPEEFTEALKDIGVTYTVNADGSYVYEFAIPSDEAGLEEWRAKLKKFGISESDIPSGSACWSVNTEFASPRA